MKKRYSERTSHPRLNQIKRHKFYSEMVIMCAECSLVLSARMCARLVIAAVHWSSVNIAYFGTCSVANAK